MNVITVTGTVDKQQRLVLDAPAVLRGRSKVRALILPEAGLDVEEMAWLAAASGNGALDFLRDPAEDIYSRTDGQPFRDMDFRYGVPPSGGSSDRLKAELHT